MSLMPTIDDSMVVQFRRVGNRRAAYRSGPSGRTMDGETRVFLQRSRGCRFFGQFCFGPNGEPGECDRDLNCIFNWNPGPDPFRL
jgi:hypothetical protein